MMDKALRAFAIMLAFVCLVGVWYTPAQAAQTGQATLTINQSFTNDGRSVPPSETFVYRLTPVTAGAPLPAGSNTAQGYVFTITGTDEVQVGPIYFSTPGHFVYELRCISESRRGYTIDRQVYTIEMHVAENLTVITVIYLHHQRKVSEITFAHSFATSLAPPTIPRPPFIIVPIPPVRPGRPPATPDEPPVAPGPAPQTGDFSNPQLWKTLILVCSVLLILIFFYAWKTRRRQES